MTPRMLLLDAVRVSDEVIAVGEQGTIVRSVDRARTWQSVPAPTRATLTGVSFAPGGQHGWVVGHDALILGTRDSGRSWARRYQGESLQDSFLDVIALDETRAIAVGAYGLFVATADGGMTWERHPSPAGDFHLNRITRGPTGTLYLAGESGTLLRSRDEGRTWTPIRAPYEGSFYGVSALDETTLLAYGLRGHLYRSTDDGVHWSAVNAPEQVMLATSVHDGATISFAGQARTLFISRDGGRTVNKVTGAPATAIAELVLLAPGVLLAVGEAGVTRIELPRGSAPPP
jgi:photosystem II stability/assembly factor-like uncharacterized protein